MMTCDDVRLRLLDYRRGRLAAATEHDVRTHLDTCVACTRADAVEHELTSVLEHRLPQHPASLALKRRLATQWPAPADNRFSWRAWWARWRPSLVPAFAALLVLVVAAPLLYYERTASSVAGARARMVAEAVNDHLRVVSSQHPLDVETSAMHQVKPWFAGRLEFAPVVPFEGDTDFPLRGGAVGYFLDRKAAVFVYARRLHPISLLIFRAEGLAWPTREVTRLGSVDVATATERGFTVMLWRRGELGYALVSDVNASELRQLAAKLAGGV